jgi:hypothetical protein
MNGLCWFGVTAPSFKALSGAPAESSFQQGAEEARHAVGIISLSLEL